MTKLKQKFFAVLDIGSTKIVCFIARMDASNRLEILGIGHQLSQGIRAGVITDIRAAESAILAAVHAAEQMAGVNVEQVFVNISGNKIQSHSVIIEEQIQGREISEREIERMIAAGFTKFDASLTEVLHCVPVDYVLDGEAGIRDPRGMFGNVLAAKLHIITTTPTALLNLANCLGRCHLNITEDIVSAYASGLACLTEDERELGSILIDMGGGQTAIAAFRDGHIIHTDNVALGGTHITSDIAWGLATNLVNAERIKILYGSAVSTPSDIHSIIEVPLMGDEENGMPQQITRAMLGDILRPRVEEILEMVKKRLNTSGVGGMGRVVLTGGASQLAGIKELASHMLGRQVRIASPRAVQGLAESTKGPAFATAIGILQFVADKSDDMIYGASNNNTNENYVRRMAGWFRDNF